MSAAPPARPGLVSGRYGSAVRALLHREARLFPEGSLAHEQSEQPGAFPSFESYLEGQFAAPIFRTGVGLESQHHTSWSAEEVRARHDSMQRAFVLDASGPVMTVRAPHARFKTLVVDPPEAFLVCARVHVRNPATPADHPSISEPMLLVVQAPTAPPDGTALRTNSIWPGLHGGIGDSGWNPTADADLFMFSASVAHETRDFNPTRINRTIDQYQESMVWCIDAFRAMSVGWIVSPTQPGSSQSPLFRTTLDGLDALVVDEFWGQGAAPRQLPADSSVVMLPRAFPLPLRHGLPAGQLWKPDIGATNFADSMQEMMHGSSAATIEAVDATLGDPVLVAWLNAVADNPAAFAIHLVSHVSIAPALVPQGGSGGSSEEMFQPIRWMATGCARRLHRDSIRCTRPTSHVTAFDQYEKRALPSAVPPEGNPNPFGPVTLSTHAFMWYARPPRPESWRGNKFSLREFTEDHTVSKQARAYVCVKVPTVGTT